MRLAVCALSAVLLSGCSWLGMGGGHGNSFGFGQGYYGAAGCSPYQASSFQSIGADGCAPGAGYGVGAGYGAGGAGYGAGGAYGPGGGAGYGAGGAYGLGGGAGYGAGGAYGLGGGSGYGAGGAYGSGGVGYGAGTGAGGAYGLGGGAYGTGAYGTGFGGVTTLGAGAPYGTALGTTGYGTTGYAGGYGTAGSVTTVQGAPIYVPQPYPAYYNAGIGGVSALRGIGGAALPFGLGLLAGTEFDLDGDVFSGKATGPNSSDFSTATAEIVSPSVSYDDAFKQSKSIGGAMEYDVSRNTTLLGKVNYSKADGKSFENGTFQPGHYDALGNFTSSGPVEAVTGEFSDLEQWTVEGGVRQYVGYNPVFRPYVGATAGFTHNNSVDLTQSSTTSLTPFTQQFIDSGWSPTASGLLGAEMAVGHRAAVGVETGIRWRDSLDTVGASSNRWSIPLQLRGRVAF